MPLTFHRGNDTIVTKAKKIIKNHQKPNLSAFYFVCMVSSRKNK